MGWLLTEKEKPYIDSAKTDVMKTWRRFGFIPPSEAKEKEKGQTNAMEKVQQVQSE